MGLRGPQKKPTVLVVAAGNPGKRQLNDDEPIPPTGDVNPPPYLDGLGLEVWHKKAPTAIAMRVLTSADVESFARYCDLQARYIVLRKVLSTFDSAIYVLKGSDGKVKCLQDRPQAVEMRKLCESLNRLEDRFGFNPAGRSRIRVEASLGVAISKDSERSGEANGPTFNFNEFIAQGGVHHRTPDERRALRNKSKVRPGA